MNKYKLEPCPFCGTELSVMESLDKSAEVFNANVEPGCCGGCL